MRAFLVGLVLTSLVAPAGAASPQDVAESNSSSNLLVIAGVATYPVAAFDVDAMVAELEASGQAPQHVASLVAMTSAARARLEQALAILDIVCPVTAHDLRTSMQDGELGLVGLLADPRGGAPALVGQHDNNTLAVDLLELSPEEIAATLAHENLHRRNALDAPSGARRKDPITGALDDAGASALEQAKALAEHARIYFEDIQKQCAISALNGIPIANVTPPYTIEGRDCTELYAAQDQLVRPFLFAAMEFRDEWAAHEPGPPVEGTPERDCWDFVDQAIGQYRTFPWAGCDCISTE
jgi:hypothetical protein